MTSREAVAAWRTEHTYFSRLLDLLQREHEALRAGKRGNYALMLDVLEYLHRYADRYHHPREDAAFAVLARQRPEVASLIERLEEDHVLLARVGERLFQHLNDAVEGLPPGDEVGDLTGTYLLFYREHIAVEERDILGRAADTLTEDDWQRVADAAKIVFDPLFGAPPEERYRELRLQKRL